MSIYQISNYHSSSCSFISRYNFFLYSISLTLPRCPSSLLVLLRSLLSIDDHPKLKLICSDVKLLQTRSFEITRIQRGLSILLLLLERDYRFYAFYAPTVCNSNHIQYNEFGFTRFSVASSGFSKQMRLENFQRHLSILLLPAECDYTYGAC